MSEETRSSTFASGLRLVVLTREDAKSYMTGVAARNFAPFV